MTVTASGVLSLPFVGVRTLLAATAQVRTECNVATPTLALPFIHLLEVDETTTVAYPRFIVSPDSEFSRTKMGPGTWNDGGGVTVSMQLVANSDYATSIADETTDILNRASLIMQQCEALAGQGTSADGFSYVNMVSWTPLGFERCEPQKENGVYYWVFNVSLRIEG